MKRGGIVFLLFVLCQTAFGYFALKSGYPQGGSVTGAYNLDYSYNPNTGAWGGGMGGTPCTASGTVTYKWEWLGDGPAPDKVIITATSRAHWGGVGGSCSNGLGDAEVKFRPAPTAPYTSGTSEGTHYFVEETDANGEVTFDLSPSASSNGSCDVSTWAVLTPIQINLTGTIQDNGFHHVMMGQCVTGSISCGSFTPSNWSWTVPLETYLGFEITAYQLTGHVVPINSSSWTTATPSWCWKGQEDLSGWIAVDCSLTVSTTGWSENVSVRTKVKLYQPVWDFASSAGTVQYLNSQSDVSAGDINATPGMTFVGKVAIPEPFFTAQGEGVWLFGQLANVYRVWNDGSPHSWITGEYRLDQEWPYNGNAEWSTGWWSPGVPTPQSTDDSPNHVVSNVLSYTIEDGFQMYQMFVPPSNGNGSYQTPLNRFDWSWNAGDSRANTGVSFTTIPPGTVVEIGEEAYPEFPWWDDVVVGY